MAKEYLQVNGQMLMTEDGQLIQVPDSENLNDLADTNGVMVTQSEEVTKEIEDLIVKNGVIDGSPRGVYANLSALQTAYPSGASGVYVCSDNGHWYYWNGSAWTDGGIYQSSGIADGSVTPEKTTFLPMYYNNLYDITDLTTVSNASITNQVITTNSLNSYNGVYLNVNSSSKGVGTKSLQAGTYFFKLKIKCNHSSNGVALKIVDSEGNQTNLSKVSGTYSTEYNDFVFKFTISTEYNNYGFILVNGGSSGDVYNLKELFLTTNENEEYSYMLAEYIKINGKSIIDNSIDASKIKDLLEEYNTFNKNNARVGYCNATNGNFNTTNTNYVYSDYIPVSILKSKTLIANGYSAIFTFFDSNKNYISGVTMNYQSQGSSYTINNDNIAYVIYSIPKANINDFEAIGYKFNSILSEKVDTKIKILCVGDSLTQGVDYDTHVINENYPYFLQKDFDFETFNYGWMGTTPITWYNRQIPLINFTFNYDVVLIMLGTNGGLTDTLNTDVEPYSSYNNFAETNTGYYCKIIEKVMEATNNKAQIILIMPPYHHFTDEKYAHLQSVRQVLPKIAERYCLPIINAYEECGINGFNGDVFRPHDNLHLNAKGYHKLATYIGNKVKSMYSKFDDNDVYDDEYVD